MGNFCPVDRDEIQGIQPKWWKELVSFATLVSLWTFVTLKMELIHIILKWNARKKLWHFGRYAAKAKLFCLKSFVPVTRASVFMWEKFHPGY